MDTQIYPVLKIKHSYYQVDSSSNSSQVTMSGQTELLVVQAECGSTIESVSIPFNWGTTGGSVYPLSNVKFATIKASVKIGQMGQRSTFQLFNTETDSPVKFSVAYLYTDV